MRIGALLVISCLLCGCIAKEVQVEAAFDPAAAAFIKAEGKATIEGHAFLKRWDGRAIHAVGEYAWLVPATPYAEERFRKLYGDSKIMLSVMQNRVANSDPRFMEFTRRTKTESNGTFRFDKVAAGSYFLVTTVSYRQKVDDILPQGGSVYERVTVMGDETRTIRVVLTDK